MPRKSEDDTPRKRGARTIALTQEPGLLMRVLLENPKDAVAGLLAFAAVSAILTNALFLQAGPHPAPMFGAMSPPAAASGGSPLPRPRPAEAKMAATEPSRTVDPRHLEPRVVEPREARVVEPRPVEPKPTESRPAERSADPMASLVKATTTPSGGPQVVRPPAPIPSPRADTTQSVQSRRVLAVQRALAENGYGQLRLTGTIDAETRAAIQNFEKDRNMPQTGQVSDRLLTALSKATGRRIE